MIVARENLKAHVCDPKKTPGIRFGPHGTESTDGFSVYLCVPYPEQGAASWPAADIVHPGPTYALDDLAAFVKATQAPAKDLAEQPLGGNLNYGSGRFRGWTKTGQEIEVEPAKVEVVFPDAQAAHEPAPVVVTEREPYWLGSGALERLLKAAKALKAKGLSIVLLPDRPFSRVALLGEDAAELAWGAVWPLA